MALKSRPATELAVSNQTGQPANVPQLKGQYMWSQMDQGPYHDKVSFATSTDLLKWTDSGRILVETASVPDAIVKDGVIYAYFVDVSTDGIAEQIGMIKSADNGQTWSDRQIIKIGGVGAKVPVDPDPFLLPDGKIRLYYFDIEANRGGKQTAAGGKNKIYSAISSDGINFTEESGVRFEYDDIYDPDVIKIGDSWRMYVGTGDQRVLSATSTDGLNFSYEGVALTSSAVPNIFHDGSKYYLFTAGINIATSSDGKTFTKSTSNFMIQGKITADSGVVRLGPNSYLMVYKTKDISTASAPGTPPPPPGN
jgi:hypothetical protein